ncbi:multiubiquitin domain-containing protein [Rhizobium rhizogenes]|uniref:multiubiquitin domain-containing protein n=1 Tax=Rhizobium rhizogenes TaxID=359 RepID=UPI0015741215|nr:multiubiquitin domain-containing protein [Rhizobium rhizogenes]NTG08849.1 hypothetical protein [Rhizobium rhizogenes]
MPSQFQFNVNGVEYVTNDQLVSGREIRTAANLVPSSDFVLIELGDKTSRSVGLEEMVDLSQGTGAFLSFEGDRVFTLTINERGYEWGSATISAANIRRYASIPEDHDLFLDNDADKPIEADGEVNLGRKGAERIVSKPKEKVKIFVNTREKFVDPGRISFSQVVRLAFPELPVGPNTSFTVSYLKGPDDKPEGTLVEGESVKVRKGMRFNVSATDKS